MQILYGAMKDEELITQKELDHIEEVRQKRVKIAKEAKMVFEMANDIKTC